MRGEFDEAAYAAEREKMLDALARWLLDNPERGRLMWKHWRDPGHHAHKTSAFLADLKVRIERQRSPRLI